MMRLAAKIWKYLHLPTNWQLGIMKLVQDQFLIGVTGVILNQNREVLLFKHTYRNYDWSLPGGYLKAGEHPKEGLEREIEEESGLTVSISKRGKIRTDRDAARLDIVYTGEFIGGEFRPSAEVSDAKFFTYENLPRISRDQLVLLNKIMNPVKSKKRINQTV
jgi:ADP-ribose pyrophosphatase YjhB (NUDIX family)